jgi:hypothetical protein
MWNWQMIYKQNIHTAIQAFLFRIMVFWDTMLIFLLRRWRQHVLCNVNTCHDVTFQATVLLIPTAVITSNCILFSNDNKRL